MTVSPAMARDYFLRRAATDEQQADIAAARGDDYLVHYWTKRADDARSQAAVNDRLTLEGSLTMSTDVDPFVAEVGARLRQLRRNLNLSLDAIEYRTERTDHPFTASALGAYERGFRVMNLPTLKAAAALYGVPMSYLLGEPQQAPQVNASDERLRDAVCNLLSTVTEAGAA